MSFGPCVANIFPAGQAGSRAPVLTGDSDWGTRVSRERLLASSRASGIPPPTFRIEALVESGACPRRSASGGMTRWNENVEAASQLTMPRDARSWLEA